MHRSEIWLINLDPTPENQKLQDFQSTNRAFSPDAEKQNSLDKKTKGELVAVETTKNSFKIKDLNEKIMPILKRYGVKKAGLFGSYVRGELTEGSDIDILVEIGEDISLLDFVGLKLEIEEALGRNVDLVEYCTIKAILRERILKEQVVVL